jgi:site-specific recombinase XerC
MPSVFKRKRRNTYGKVVESRKYTCQYIDATTGKVCRVPGFTDKGESWEHARKLEAGTATPDHRKHQRTPLADHLDAFVRHLQAQNDSPKYVRLTELRIKKLLDGCKFQTLRQINLPDVENWLAEQRTAKLFGIGTSNEYGSALRQFLSWLVDAKRAGCNPLAGFSPLNDATDEKRERRALKPDEFAKLIASTLAGPVYRDEINGTDRAMLYVVAAFTGLRVAELASLTPESFDLDAGVVVVAAACSKRRRLDRQPLPPDLVQQLRAWLPGRSGKLWIGRWSRDAASMLREDLKAAGIPYVDGAGKFLDFHALGRHTFCTNLALANVPPKVAQSLARHSTIALTLDLYSHVHDSDAKAGLAKLPAVPPLTQKLTHPSVVSCHDVAQSGTTHDGRSYPESTKKRLPNGYFADSRPVCYGSEKLERSRLETCSTRVDLPQFFLFERLVAVGQVELLQYAGNER